MKFFFEIKADKPRKDARKMTATIFTYIGVIYAAYLFVFPFLQWLDWGKKR